MASDATIDTGKGARHLDRATHLDKLVRQASIETAYLSASDPVRAQAECARFGLTPYTADQVEQEMGPDARRAWEAIGEARKAFFDIARTGGDSDTVEMEKTQDDEA